MFENANDNDANVATVWVRSQHPPTQWDLGAADEAVLKNVHKKKKNPLCLKNRKNVPKEPIKIMRSFVTKTVTIRGPNTQAQVLAS